MQRHPWGKVPVLTTENGFTLYESRAICKYLAAKYSFPLLPASTNVDTRAVFDQAECVEMLSFAPPAGVISYEKFAKERFMGLPADEVRRMCDDCVRVLNGRNTPLYFNLSVAFFPPPWKDGHPC